MNYLIVNMKDEYFICAEKRLPEIARRYNCEKPKKLYQFQGSALLDIIANEPIFNRDLQILADNGVPNISFVPDFSRINNFNSYKLFKNSGLNLKLFKLKMKK